ncbi:MAG: SDR family oxidoreductase [Myxococcales bacterium]|nr:SDR family oxidoreductase [Myxococcales bacterium]
MSTNAPAEGRTALVQGGSRGIGLALVRDLLLRPDVGRGIATARRPEASDGLRELRESHGDALTLVALDASDEPSIAAAAEGVAGSVDRLHLLVNCAGILHDGEAIQPEKRIEHVDPAVLRRVFEVNAFGPLLVAKHFHALLAHDERAVLANLSARVGSLSDNRAGGWYAYRASKAAQNMFTRNLAIELRRRARNLICVALHPGTVDTGLSRPFQGSVPPEQLFPAERAARQLLEVIDSLEPDDSGGFFAWDRAPIPW